MTDLPAAMSMANTECLRSRYREGGPVRATEFFPFMPLTLSPPTPPRREVVLAGAGLFTVDGWCMATTDPVLAEAVAREFDRIDPLPTGWAYPSIGTERRREP